MKKNGILQNELAQEIARSGHLDKFVIGDAGFPVPQGVKCIDLALIQGQPSFLLTLEAVLEELKVQEAILAKETGEVSPQIEKGLRDMVNNEFTIKEVTHDELKEISKEAKVIIRTGEFTPYANIVLIAGVMF